MPIRVIGGCRRGAILATLGGGGTRPLLGRIRQSLFDMLGGWTVDACVLDLFAGSGAVGLEALSRGARWGLFVDASPEAAGVIRKNIQKLRFEDRARIECLRLPGCIDRLPMAPGMKPFDLVFIMPPFDGDWLGPVLDALGRRGDLLAPGAILVCQLPVEAPVPEAPWAAGGRPREARIIGRTRLIFWEAAGA